MAYTKGFTLIELMVVLLIIGITLHFTSQSWGDFGEKRRVIMAAEQLKMQVTGLQHQAILAGSSFGLSVSATGYKVVSFQGPGGWVINAALHAPVLPARVILHSSTKKQLPTVVIDPQGNVQAFRISLGTMNRPDMVCVVGSDTSEILVKVGCK